MGIFERSVKAFACALAFLLALPALAQATGEAEAETGSDNVFERGCGDDSGLDRCAAQVQNEMRKLYGWSTAEELVERGVRFRRFMMVDGYGRDILGLIFERPAGASPSVSIEVPRSNQRGIEPNLSPSSLSAKITESQWQEVISLTEDFDQKLAREAGVGEDGDEITICLHGWYVVMEAGEPAVLYFQSSEPKIRRDEENACDDGLAMPAAFRLANIAIEMLPECQGLDLADFRNAVTLLSHCKQLGGDRLVATKIGGFVEELEAWEGPSEVDALAHLFVPDSKEEAERLATDLLANWEETSLFWGVPHAHDIRNATLLGSMTRTIEESDSSATYGHRKITMKLRGFDTHWRIASYTISDETTVTETFQD